MLPEQLIKATLSSKTAEAWKAVIDAMGNICQLIPEIILDKFNILATFFNIAINRNKKCEIIDAFFSCLCTQNSVLNIIPSKLTQIIPNLIPHRVSYGSW